MSQNGLGASPVARAQSRLDELYGVEAPAEASSLDSFKALSRKTKVPVNLLLALDEGRGDLKAAESNAQRLAAAAADGTPFETAITDLAGDPARGAALLESAYAIADRMQPQAPAPADTGNDGKVGVGEALGGLGRDVATGAVRSTGGAIEALGVAADEVLRYGADPAQDGPTIAREIGRWAGDGVRGAGEAIAEGRSEDYKQVRAGTQPGGDLTDPSTWTMGEDPSVLGALGIAAEGIGSMAPIVAAPGARAAAAVGGLMGAGEGIESGRTFVETAATTLDEAGRPEIEKLPEYQELTQGGMEHGRAVEELSRRAENNAGFRQAMVASLGGAATNRIMRGAEGALASGSRVAKAAKKGAAGAAEEGLQEVAEGAAAASGIEAGTGADLNVMEDSFGNFIGGALTGAGMGVAAGALTPGEQAAPRPEPQPETPPPLLALPAPDGGPTPNLPVASPRLIAHDPNVQNPDFVFPGLPSPESATAMGAAPEAPEAVSTGTDMVSAPRLLTGPMTPTGGSGEGPAPAPDLSPPSLGLGAGASTDLGIAPPAPSAPPAPPVGPVEAIAQQLQASMPQPAPEAPIRFPDQKPGSEILLGNEDGANEKAVFLGETPNGGAMIRISGQEIELTAEQFDKARNQADTNLNREETDRGKLGGLSVAASLGAKPPVRVRMTVEEEFAQLPPDQARKRLEALTNQARHQGWDTRRSNLRKILEGRIALGGDFNVEPAAAPDQAGGPAPAQPVRMGDDGTAGDQGSAPVGDDLGAGAGGSGGMGAQPQPGNADGEGQPDPVGGVDVPAGTGELAQPLTPADIRKVAATVASRGDSGAGFEKDGTVWETGNGGPLLNMKTKGGPRMTGRKGMIYVQPQGSFEVHAFNLKNLASENPAQSNPEVLTVEPADPFEPKVKAAHEAAESFLLNPAGKTITHSGGEVAIGEHRLPSAAYDRIVDRLIGEGKLDQDGNPVAAAPGTVAAAAEETNPEPTDGQKEAENYKTGKATWNGLRLSVENKKGSTRSGTDPNGQAWSVEMPANYGRILRTEGADGDHVDFYMGDNEASETAFVIDQMDAETGAFDEHKVMLGFDTAQAARDAHASAFSDGKGAARMGGITKMPVADLKEWLKNGDTKNPVSAAARRKKKAGNVSGDKQTQAKPAFKDIADMTRDEFIEAHRDRVVKVGNKRKRGIVLTDTDISTATERHVYYPPAGAKPTSNDDALGMIYDATYRIGSRAKAAASEASAKEAQDEYKARRDLIIPAFEERGVDFEALAETRARALSRDRIPTDRDQIERMVVMAFGADGKDVSDLGMLHPDNPKSRAIFETIWGVKLPKTQKDLRQMLKDGAFSDLSKLPKKATDQNPIKSETPANPAPEPAPAPKAKKPVKKPAATKELTWADFNESDLNDPKMPEGYELTSIRRLTKQEAEAEGYQWPAMKAVVKRDRPAGTYKVESAISENSRSNAIAAALERAKKGADPQQEAPKAQPEAPKAQPSPASPLTGLTDAEAARLAEVKAKLAARLRGQANSGLDPEILGLAVEMTGLYLKAGVRRFGAILRDFMADTGLTAAQSQRYVRAAYNDVRDNMDLDGQDVSDMDDASAVMAEVRAALAEPAAPVQEDNAAEPAGSDTIEPQEGANDAGRTDGSDGADSAQEDQSDAEAGGGTLPETGAGRSDQDSGDAGSGRKDRGAGASGSRSDGRDDHGGSLGGTDGARGPRNHVIPEGGLQVSGGDKTRARNAVKAIEIVRTLEREGRPATYEERQALALYGGAGVLAPGLPNSEGKIRFADIAADLDRLLSPQEKASVEKTSQYAFYTAEPVLRTMWDLAHQLGFKGGKVFEPGMGVGGFAGTMPKHIFGEYHGLELDPITAKIAAALYPHHHIKQGDFIQTKMPRDYYDLVIGNPPFARTQIKADPDYPQGFMIHDYFFAKSLDAVRPGGLLMFVTSAGTLNKMDSKARDYMADKADLVGAIRLPNTAFSENGTQVTTDIIVLRRRMPGEKEANPAWRESAALTVPDKDGGTVELNVNRYFHDRPEMILGEQGAFDTLVGRNRIGVRPKPGADLKRDLRAVLASFPENVMSKPDGAQMMDGPRDATATETKTGSFYLKDGELWQFDGREGKPVQRKGKSGGGMSKADYDLISQLVPLRNALRAVYAKDLRDEDAKAERAELNRLYDAFVEKNGPINKPVITLRRPSAVEIEGMRQRAAEDARANGDSFDIGSFDAGPMIEAGESMAAIARARREAAQQPGYREGDFDPDAIPDKAVTKFPNIDPFSEDPENFRLRAIEHYDDKTQTAAKTTVFRENAVRRSVQPKISSPEDALLYLLAERGRVDIEGIADLSGTSPERVKSELAGKIFFNPVTSEFETRSKYLSGNVRQKLREAREAARRDDAFIGNVEALEKVIPDPVGRNEIVVPLGAHWFDHDLYSQFARAKGLQLSVKFRKALGRWEVSGDNRSTAAVNEWGTADLPFADLMGKVMNNKALRVTRSKRNADGSTETWVDEEATQAANDKAAELRAAFAQWVWSDEARAEQLEEAYNEAFNATVAPSYDGSYLTTPGIHSGWSWRPHQTAVVARILQDGSTYMAHAVGAGKTSAMIGAGMEARRLGLARKPWYNVPNHMLMQFAKEFQEQYPLANILVADETRFQGDKRRQFVADAASGEYDAVIITHSAFELIPVSDEAKAAVIQPMLDDIRDMVQQVADEKGERDAGAQQAILGALSSIVGTLGIKQTKEKGTSTAKKIAQMLEQAEQRLSKLTANTGKDEVVNFDEIGVDMLFTDEAHLFRKLSFTTGMSSIKGIDPKGSQMSMDLFIKTRAVDRRNPGRGIVMASGTPITNTMAELFTVQRFMQPDTLEAHNMSAFDAWAATFGQTSSELEQTPDGGYKEVSRFSRFVNTPELSLMVRQFMDVVTSNQLAEYVTRPSLRGGGRNLVVVEATEEQKEYQKELAQRMKALANRKGPPKKGDDNILSVTGDGRLAAIDMRLIDPNATGAGSKLEQMIQSVFWKWKEGKNTPFYGVKPGGGYTDEPVSHGPSAQIIFSTLGVNATGKNPAFSVHRHIKSSLIRMGVPESEIILAGELKNHAQRQRAFNDMNEGKKRILIGSKSIFTGVNAQKRLAEIHNLDPLWFPADDEQRNGRGIRQGNMNREIGINDYSTKGTYDATMWQMMARKAAFIEAFYRGDPTQREMEDMGEASAFEQAKAMTTRDPRVLQLTEMKQDRDKLARRAGAIDTQRARLRREIRDAQTRQAFYEEKAAEMEPIAAMVPDTAGDAFKVTIGKAVYDSRKEAGQALLDVAEKMAAGGQAIEEQAVGKIGPFTIFGYYYQSSGTPGFGVRHAAFSEADAGISDDPVGLIRRIEGNAQQPIGKLKHYRDGVTASKRDIEEAREALAKVQDFAQGAELADISERIAALEAELLADNSSEEEDGEKQSRFGEGESISPEEARRINAAARAELERVGIAGRVKALAGGEGTAIGSYQRGVIRLLRARSGKWKHTLDHEIIHALHDGDLWNRSHGLFEAEEWRALVRAAKADPEVSARVEAAYPDLDPAQRAEEMVAEFYADWAAQRREAPRGLVSDALSRIRSFFNAVASALRGEGFVDAARIMQGIADGEIGGRGPDGSGGGNGRRGRAKEQRDMPDLGRILSGGKERAAGMVSRENWKKLPSVFSGWLTDAMGKNDRFNLLAAVPGQPLFAELGKNLSAAQTYLRHKQEMDAERNEWQARAAGAVDRWTQIGRKNHKANDALMDLMHKTTLAGIDPSKDLDDQAEIVPADSYARLKAEFDALPAEFQALYSEIRDEYSAMADATDQAVLDNVETANRIALKRAKKDHAAELRRIADKGLKGAERDEAIRAADEALTAAEDRARAQGGKRIASLRAAFESNRQKGPYFPLARFGTYFVTVRDASGEVISFSRFETKAQQDTAIKELEEEGQGQGWQISRGVLGGDADLKGMVSPKFVAEVEDILAKTGASDDTMDAIWQHWLQSLPDMSVRKSRIHRKGRKGFNRDAIRAFSSAMFHGAHHLARLRYGLEMDDNLNDAEDQAARQPDPERAGFVVREMRQRHNFTMSPTNNPLVTAGTSLAFVWYLGMSPAAAMVNLSQTTIFGIPIMATRFKKAGLSGTSKALLQASKDFIDGKTWAEKSKNLTPDEKAAMHEGYRRGTIDRTQSHDLAAVAESGVQYNPGREKAMRVIGFLFHHTERANREVTFLAAYRLLRDEGKSFDDAMDESDAMVKKVHFSYQNTDRPRLMQGDAAKLILAFRNFTVNALYRLFRDAHQAFKGDTPEARREARGQLVGVTLSMFAHAGIKGVWGYGLLMMLLGFVFPGDDDDIEQWLHNVLLMEGDDPATASWNWLMGMVLNGVPGHVAGVSLTERIGMPSLWFREPREGTEGMDLWAEYLNQIAGPVIGIGGSFFAGLSMMGDAWGDGNGENFARGAEKIIPGFAADLIKPIRFITQGANTYYGDPLMEVGPLDALRVALGFTPAELAERYEINARLKAREQEITARRARIHRRIGEAAQGGDGIPENLLDEMRAFNAEFPEYPITPDTIRQSMRSRASAKAKNEDGVSLNPRLNDRIRGELAPAIY